MEKKRFEDLVVWQKARVLTRSVYESTRQERFSRDFGLAGQIQRAAVSVMSNIAEGYERGNPGDFHRFLLIAKASCAEIRSHLYVVPDADYLPQADFDRLTAQAEEVSRLLSGLYTSVKRQRERNA